MARYIPILRLMRGERVALQNLSQPGRTNVAPMFVLAPKQYVGRKATKKNPAVLAPNVIANDIMTAWGTAPFFLDASALAPAANGHHPIADIAAACRAIGLQLVPATPLYVSAQYQQGVQTVAAADHRGVGLRVDLNGVSSAGTWMPQWPFPLPQTDLIVDIGDNAAMVAGLGAAVTHVFQTLPSAGQWRSVTFAGTSMPENFTGLAAGKYLVPRAEVSVWQQLANAHLPYQIDFGDYASIPTAPAPSGIAWGFPINARYTLASEFLICRGVATTGFGAVDMGPQLIGHANMIVAHVGRGPLAHCWADTIIDLISAGAVGPQNLEHWVQLGVNRHIELVRHLLP